MATTETCAIGSGYKENTIMMAAQGLSLAYGVYTKWTDYQSQNAALDYQSNVQKYQAGVNETRAKLAEEDGEVQERLELMKAANQAGVHMTTEVGGGTGGAEVGVGSRYDAVEDIEVTGQMYGKLASRNAAVEAWDYRTQAQANKANAEMYRSQKFNAFDMVSGTLMSNAERMGDFGQTVATRGYNPFGTSYSRYL